MKCNSYVVIMCLSIIDHLNCLFNLHHTNPTLSVRIDNIKSMALTRIDLFRNRIRFTNMSEEQFAIWLTVMVNHSLQTLHLPLYI